MVHIVDDLGADPNGGQIAGILENNVGDNTIVEFPENGEFVLEHAPSLSGSGWELRGNGARLYQEGQDLMATSGTGYVVDGFEIDVSRVNQRTQIVTTGDGYRFSRIIFRGYFTDTGKKVFVIETNGPNGADFEWIYFPEQQVGDREPYGVGGMGAFGNSNTFGGISVRNCWFRGFGGTTLYMSQTSSRVTVENCFFHNTMNGARLYRATMRNCTSVLDGPLPDKRGSSQTWTGWMGGPWLDGEQSAHPWGAGDPEVLIEDCDVYFDDDRVQQEGALASRAGTPGPVTVRNTRVHNTTNEHSSIDLRSPENHEIRLENVEVSGNNDVNLVGNVTSDDYTFTSGAAADPTPPIPSPPPYGEIPSGGPECEGPNDCPDGETCSDGTCVECVAESDCPEDMTCENGRCVPDIEELSNTLEVTGTGTATNYEFSVTGVLGGDSSTLSEHDNISGSSANAWVTETSHTDRFFFSGQVSNFGYAQGGPVSLNLNGDQVSDDDIVGLPEEDTGCTSDNECPGTQVCRNGNCVPECASDSDCPNGEVCNGGTCEEEPTEPPEPGDPTLDSGVAALVGLALLGAAYRMRVEQNK